jgi:hypothetical protein
LQFRLANELPQAGLDHARKEGKMNADLARVGLEPTKAAYEQRMAYLRSTGQVEPEKRQSWISKLVHGDREKEHPPAPGQQAAMAKPCVVGECKPTPPPCTGKNCRPLPCTGPNCSVPPPVAGQNSGCEQEGYPFNSQMNVGCVPLGYIDHCDRQGQCYAHLGQVNGSYCDAILDRLNQQKKLADDLQKTQQSACRLTPRDAQCVSATTNYQAADAAVQQLEAKYQMCRMAAGSGNNTRTPPTVGTPVPPTP